MADEWDGGIGRGLRHLGIAWTCLALCGLLLMALAPAGSPVGGFVLGIGTAGCGLAALRLASAGRRVRRDRDVVLWNGLVSLHAWNPTEGVVFLRDGGIDLVDDRPRDGGGVRLVYPWRGEQLALRVPLRIQSLAFGDGAVLTREHVPLSVRGTLQWRICGLGQFYLKAGRRLHMAEQWLRAMADEKTRIIVSQVGAGFLVAEQLEADLTGMPRRSWGAADGLASRIKADFASAASWYGLEVLEVWLHEVRLPAEFHADALAACREARGSDVARVSPTLAVQDRLASHFAEVGRRRLGG